MAVEQFANNAQSTLSAAITSGATALTVASAGAFPSVPQFRIIVEDEIMLVTGVSGTTFTVTRGVEGTAAAAHATTTGGNPTQVTHVLTAASLAAVTLSTQQATGGLASRSTNQLIATGSATALQWTTEVRDDNNFVDISGHNTRITVPANGWYHIVCYAHWDSSTFGMRALDIRINGSTFIGGLTTNQASGGRADAVCLVSLNRFLSAGDYIEAIVFENSGSSLNVTDGHLSAVKFG